MADEMSKDADKIQNRSNDEELNALLDSALLDFDKGSIESKTKSTAVNSDSNAKADKSDNVSSTPENNESQVGDMFGEDPLIKLMMSQFEQTFQSLLQEDGETEESTKEWAEVFRKDFKNLAEVTMKEVKDEASSDEPSNEFSSTIAETLKSLSENADNLQANGGDVMNMLGSLGLGGLGDGSLDNPGDFSSAFNNIMQMFLSKDVLYPALKQLVTKYPAWLEENQSTLSKDDYSRFSKQLEIMTKVCSEMESATDNDSEEVKSKRFSDILQLMHQMEEFGHPPKSLLGDSFDIPQWL